jgi:hypothetical protein
VEVLFVDESIPKKVKNLELKKRNLKKNRTQEIAILLLSVADPDPEDPYVLRPPGSVSGSFNHQGKIVG